MDKVHGLCNVLILIQVKSECIIGGYTKTGWNRQIHKQCQITDDEEFSQDKDAFVFYLKSPNNKDPFISNVKQDEESIKNALGYARGYYGIFGYTWLFMMMPGDEQNTFDLRGANENYETYPYGWKYVTGKYYNDESDIVIEAFQIEM